MGCQKTEDKIARAQDLEPEAIVSAYSNRLNGFDGQSSSENISEDITDITPNVKNLLMGFTDSLGASRLITLEPEIMTKNPSTLDDARAAITGIYVGNTVGEIFELYIEFATDEILIKKFNQE